jgi:hypothetical protein
MTQLHHETCSDYRGGEYDSNGIEFPKNFACDE